MLVQTILKSKDSADVVTIRSDASVAEAAKLLAENHIGGVVVSDDGIHVQGILSERDIVRELAKVGSGCLVNNVGSYMTRKIVTCTSQCSVEEVMQRMTDGRFRHMPVVEEGTLVGIVTIGDLVKAQLSELAMEKNALEGMIMGH
ncbi:CBS domain-containing protein [Pseudodonghicola xiamenensis]|uniref:Inosine-5-monophosphate dehydrogenase n=1 Tax=Pseudodonghicola xiamenensis TaxID=337702 RepID=A0A8J3H7M6_9RHOB|nr:CBS domain-containing protein [Pseudodonghicola xiamenensis]GHG87567.1 inosine-5-monophosphate dehydrogenase [Pseudodonghicola xiamenensis]